jgi:hypothetical protein
MLASAFDPYYQPIVTTLTNLSEVSFFIFYLFISSVSVATVLLIWNDTNAFVEYARLLGFKMSGYEYDEKLGISYPDYLESKYNNFIVTLLACPICLSVWLNLGAYFIHKFGWVLVCGIYFSLIFYFLFKIIMKKSDG